MSLPHHTPRVPFTVLHAACCSSSLRLCLPAAPPSFPSPAGHYQHEGENSDVSNTGDAVKRGEAEDEVA